MSHVNDDGIYVFFSILPRETDFNNICTIISAMQWVGLSVLMNCEMLTWEIMSWRVMGFALCRQCQSGNNVSSGLCLFFTGPPKWHSTTMVFHYTVSKWYFLSLCPHRSGPLLAYSSTFIPNSAAVVSIRFWHFVAPKLTTAGQCGFCLSVQSDWICIHGGQIPGMGLWVNETHGITLAETYLCNKKWLPLQQLVALPHW